MPPKSKPTNGHTHPTKACAIYVRVSSERQADPEANSVPEQLKQCRALAAKLGYRVAGEYVDAEKYKSGKRMVEPGGGRVDRPALLRMLADGRDRKFGAVVAWKQDRLVRGLRASVTLLEWLEETGADVVLVKETFDRKYFQLLAAVSGMELENIRERLRMGRLGRASRGLWHGGGRLPLGYLTDEQNGVLLDPEWKDWLSMLARRFLDGEAYSYLARTLPVPPGLERRLPHGAIMRLIRNPWYAGYITHKGDVYPGQHEPAWDTATWQAIQKELGRRVSTPSVRSSSVFNGVLRCGFCGGSMIVCTRHQDRRSYGCWKYIDANRRGETPPHSPNYIREAKAFRFVHELVSVLTRTDVADFVSTLPAAADPGYVARLEADRAKAAAEHADMASAVEGLGQTRARTILENELADLQAELARLDSELSHARAGEVDRAALLAAYLEVLQQPDLTVLPAEQANVYLRRLFPAGLFAASGTISITPPKHSTV